MSNFYKPNRNPEYSYGGSKWTLSRSKIDLFLDCRRCFYLDNKLGVARPPGFPFNLNSAVDALLKKELDVHRAQRTVHPLAQAYGLNLVPLAHTQMDAWRDALKRGVSCVHKETGLTVRGGVDDIWINEDGELVVIDYKATSKDGRIDSLDEEWHKGYKRQLEIYQWLLRQNGFKVSDTGYWFYANATKDRTGFDGRLDFELTLVPYKGSTDWVDGALVELKACLDGGVVPAASADCDYCRYRQAAGEALMKASPKPAPKIKKSPTIAKKKSGHEKTSGQLF
ncbi:MAG: PD-(D/E)XK nuclease family protein [Patescibacteria group bacterium]|nr:PD-(D/E)XK nuclease family protein [Patescibacteria group bacterium]